MFVNINFKRDSQDTHLLLNVSDGIVVIDGFRASRSFLLFSDKFFDNLRHADIPVSITEFLTLLRALEKNIISINLDNFYYLARSCLIKDEKHFDRFDIVFSNCGI